MKTFEYRYEDLISLKALDDAGKDGWELVCIAHDRCFFKREIQ